MIGVIPYYEQAATNYRKTYNPGQFYSAPVPFVLPERPRRLQLGEYVPENPSLTTFSLLETDLTTFRPEEDPPLRGVRLAQDQFILASAHKRRTVVLVSDPMSEESGVPEESALVVPAYGLRDDAGNYKSWASAEFLRKAQGYQFTGLFYLPDDATHGVEESVLRFDRMLPMPFAHMQPRPYVLTGDATSLLREWLYHFLGAPLFNTALEEYIRRASSARPRA